MLLSLTLRRYLRTGVQLKIFDQNLRFFLLLLWQDDPQLVHILRQVCKEGRLRRELLHTGHLNSVICPSRSIGNSFLNIWSHFGRTRVQS